MPRYDFLCTTCSQVFELDLPVARRSEATCPQCGSRELRQVFLSAPMTIAGGGVSSSTGFRGG